MDWIMKGTTSHEETDFFPVGNGEPWKHFSSGMSR